MISIPSIKLYHKPLNTFIPCTVIAFVCVTSVVVRKYGNNASDLNQPFSFQFMHNYRIVSDCGLGGQDHFLRGNHNSKYQNVANIKGNNK